MVSIIVTLQKCLCLSIKSSRVPSAFLFSALCDVRECVSSPAHGSVLEWRSPTYLLFAKVSQSEECLQKSGERGTNKDKSFFFSVTHANTVRDER